MRASPLDARFGLWIDRAARLVVPVLIAPFMVQDRARPVYEDPALFPDDLVLGAGANFVCERGIRPLESCCGSGTFWVASIPSVPGGTRAGLFTMSDAASIASRLMDGYLARTCQGGASPGGDRYLWTDALAVCNLLSLRDELGEEHRLGQALDLVDRVHRTLGRHRADDPRTGWISGLDEGEGALRPTVGGLRIGKRLPERGPREPLDEQAEWERDGQYFHYLTRWAHALHRVFVATGDDRYLTWALELMDSSLRAFTHESYSGRKHLFWKMSIDRSRPLVPSMGRHDALDGYVTSSLLESARRRCAGDCGPGLGTGRQTLRTMCEGASWVTDDELGIGGLLLDACVLSQLVELGVDDCADLIDVVLLGVERSMRYYARHNRLLDSAEQRLAFRELGLSIGLRGVDLAHEAVRRHPNRFDDFSSTHSLIRSLQRFGPVIRRIEGFWLEDENQRARSWTGHLDINEVMLATSLAPGRYLTISDRAGLGQQRAAQRKERRA